MTKGSVAKSSVVSKAGKAKPVLSHEVANVRAHVPSMNGKASSVALKQAGEGETQIGDVFWYSVPDAVEVPAHELFEKAAAFGIDEAWLPKAIVGANAFKRATEVLRQDRRLVKSGVVNDEVFREIVRVVEAPKKPQFRHIVKEVCVGTSKPKYRTLGHIAYMGDATGLVAEAEPGISREDEAHFQDMVNVVAEKIDHYSKVYIDKDMRNVLARARYGLMAFSVRDSGGIFFSLLEERPRLHALKEFLAELPPTPQGRRCRISVIPASEASKNPLELAENFADAVSAECDRLLKTVQEITTAGKPIKQSRFDTVWSEFQWVLDLYEKMHGLMAEDVEGSAFTLQVVQDKFRDLRRLVKS